MKELLNSWRFTPHPGPSTQNFKTILEGNLRYISSLPFIRRYFVLKKNYPRFSIMSIPKIFYDMAGVIRKSEVYTSLCCWPHHSGPISFLQQVISANHKNSDTAND